MSYAVSQGHYLFYYIQPCLQQKMFACVNVNLYFSLFGLFCGRAVSRISSRLEIIVTIEQSKTWRFANLFQFKVNVFSPLNEYFWLGIIGVCRLRYTCRSSSFFFRWNTPVE
jgi:hypothetical protein